MPSELLQGSEAVAEAAIAAQCRFFTGYPMLPFTDLLESLSKRLPEVGGVCMNATLAHTSKRAFLCYASNRIP